jgi:hypothetical protein
VCHLNRTTISGPKLVWIHSRKPSSCEALHSPPAIPPSTPPRRPRPTSNSRLPASLPVCLSLRSKTSPRITPPTRRSRRGSRARRPWATANTLSPSPPSGSCPRSSALPLRSRSGEIWFTCGGAALSCSSISLQPVGEASADRARAHGGRIRADLARDQRYYPFNNRFPVLSSLAIDFAFGREVRGFI